MFAWAHINRKSNRFTKLLYCNCREIKARILELEGTKSFHSMSCAHMFYKRYSAVQRAQLKHCVPALWFLLYSPSNALIQRKEIRAQKQRPDPLARATHGVMFKHPFLHDAASRARNIPISAKGVLAVLREFNYSLSLHCKAAQLQSPRERIFLWCT